MLPLLTSRPALSWPFIASSRAPPALTLRRSPDELYPTAPQLALPGLPNAGSQGNWKPTVGPSFLCPLLSKSTVPLRPPPGQAPTPAQTAAALCSSLSFQELGSPSFPARALWQIGPQPLPGLYLLNRFFFSFL